MLRRLPTLLLAALVVLTSVALGTCPVGRCAAMQAGAGPRADAGPQPQHADHATPDGSHGGHQATHHGSHGGHQATHHDGHGGHQATHHDGNGVVHAAQHAGHGAAHGVRAQAPGAHDCCTRDGITAPSCCPDSMQIAEHEAAAAVERAGAGVALVATQAVPASLAALPTAAADPPRRVPLGAPPGTLIAQHTSLLV